MKRVDIAVYVDTDSQEDAVHVANLLRGNISNIVTNPSIIRTEVETPVDHVDAAAPALDVPADAE